MNRLSNHTLVTAAILSVLLCLPGCQSKLQAKPQAKSAKVHADTQTLTAKQQEYDQLLEEWKTLKPGLSRLLAIEGELNLLLGQLEQLSSSLEASQGPGAIAQKPATEAAPVPTAVPLPADAELVTAPIALHQLDEPLADTYTPAQDEAPEETETARHANFALQVASITDMRQLPGIWQAMMDKNSLLLANLEPNFQKTNIRNTDYYRLKLGGFSTQQDAAKKCNELKSAGVSCIVTHYTSSNFAQLADYHQPSLAAQNLLNLPRH